MGYVIVQGQCLLCKKLFAFNPKWVPSFRVPEHGEKQPVCRECMDEVNEARRNNGVPPFKIHANAYEPADENEIDWG